MEQFDVRILGPLEVVLGGSSLALGGHKQRAVLAMLATRSGSAVSSDQLIELLWSGSPPATAATTVQVYVSRLRKLLGADRIETSGGGYVLRVEPDELDAARFRELVSQGRAVDALALWRGPALADFAYESWAQAEAGRLEEERLACLEERIDADLESGRHGELVGELEALVAEHPLRERLRSQLMLALYRAGRQAEALEAYQRARSTLVEELGIEPGPELQELNRRILQQDVSLAPVGGTRHLPTGTVTLLATDIDGSTQLLAEIGSEAYSVALAEHRRALRGAVAAHQGIEVDTQGDGFLIAFARASDAVAAAIAAQRAFTDGPLRVRMGLHSGEPLLTDEGYVGLDVHQAARVMSAGHGGQVLISDATRVLLDSSIAVRHLGRHRLKDLTAPQPLYQLGEAAFPPLRTLHHSTLPVQPTPLVGRKAELGEVSRLLHDSRLVTLTGAGGSGKTRLALQSAADLVDRYVHGVWWVSLAALRDAELVEPTIAQVVGAKTGLAEYLRGMNALLVLDNFEHLLDAAPRIASLLEAAADVHVLATSRQRLGIAAEQEYPVPTLLASEAVALFVARARRLKPRFQPDEHVPEICRRLDRLPLAIELAAARITILTPERILKRLGRSLDLLTAGARDAPERQQTLRATIEWSYDLLAGEAKKLFRRLAVFAGSFDIEAAEAVAEADLETLADLVDKSLLHQRDDGRFFLLETVREYAEEHLQGEADAARRGHLVYFLGLAEEGSPHLRGREQPLWLRRFEIEHPNLRAAIDWAQASGEHADALRLCAALGDFWRTHGHLREGLRRLGSSLEHGQPAAPQVHAAALDAAAFLAHAQGDYASEQRFAEEQFALCQRLGYEKGRARALSNLGLAAAGAGDIEHGAKLLEESVRVAREDGDPWTLMVSAQNLGWVALVREDYVTAETMLEDALAKARECGDEDLKCYVLVNLATVRLETAEYAAARILLAECLETTREIGSREVAIECLELLAAVTSATGSSDLAALLLGAADAEREILGAAREPYEQTLYDRTMATLQVQLSKDVLGESWAAGKALEFDEAVDYGRKQIVETA